MLILFTQTMHLNLYLLGTFLFSVKVFTNAYKLVK